MTFGERCLEVTIVLNAYFTCSKSFMSKRIYEMVFATRECVMRRMLKEDYDNLEGIIDS